MATETVTPLSAKIAAALDSPEIETLIRELDALRWTGRKGYATRRLVGACLVKHLTPIREWSRTAAAIADNPNLQQVLGDTPSVHACYRFAKKLRERKPLLDACLDRLAASLRVQYPEYGRHIAIDGSAVRAYSNGQKRLWKDGPLRERFSDPDASPGHCSASSTQSGGFVFGFKAHAAVCVETELPIVARMETAKRQEVNFAVTILDAVIARGFQPRTCVMDEGYDSATIHAAFEERDCHPVIHMRRRTVKRGEHLPPRCEHGEWRFGGAENDRKAAKWLCPTAECCPPMIRRKASRLHPLIPYGSARWKKHFATRGAVERVYGRLKEWYGLTPVRVRGLERVSLHADLCVFARLTEALVLARAAP